MALRALKIVEEVLNREVERLHARMDNMVENHRRRVSEARRAINGKASPSDPLEARQYLDSCGPALTDQDYPDWVTLPWRDLQKHSEFGRTAARIQLVRDSLTERIAKECIEQPDPDDEALDEVLDNLFDRSETLVAEAEEAVRRTT